jgi:hypothetical protein
MGVPASGRDAISDDDELDQSRSLASKTTVLDEPMHDDELAVDQDLGAQMERLRAAVFQLEVQKIADDARYVTEIAELRGKVAVLERIRMADALRYNQDLEERDAVERVRRACDAAALAHATDAAAVSSSALRHAHGHCTSCHGTSLGLVLCDAPIPASRCVV